MPKRSEIRLTDTELRTLKAQYKGREAIIFDKDEPGFGVRIKPSGTITFLIQYRRGIRTRRFALKGQTKAADARNKAKGLLSKIKDSIAFDPSMERRVERRKAVEAEAGLFEVVAKNFLADIPETRRSRPETERILFGKSLDESRTPEQRKADFKGYIAPAWRGRHILTMRRPDVNALLRKVKAENGREMARKVLEVLRELFQWYEGEDEAFASPIVRQTAKIIGAPVKRERVLCRVSEADGSRDDDDELRKVWRAAGKVSPAPFGALVRALLLTGARRDELAGARWSEIDESGTCLTVPPERVKKERGDKEPKPKPIPLTVPVVRLLETLPRLGDYIFTTNGTTPISGFSKAKRAIDDLAGVTEWRLHDLRRTARTLMSRAGVNPEHAELAIGHKLRGVRETYDRHAYPQERRATLEALAKLLERILDGSEAQVIQFGAKKRAAKARS